MDYKVHLSTGVFISLLLVNFIGYNVFTKVNIIIHILILFFSIFPDIDIYNSKIGRQFGFVSRIIQFIFGHRGVFHSLWMAMFLYIVLLLFGLEIAVVGYLGHLIVDMFTKDGVKLLYPAIQIKGILPTNKVVNFTALIVMIGFDCILMLNLFYRFL